MRQKITLKPPKSMRNAVKDDTFRVLLNESDDFIEVFLYGVVGDEYTESDAGSINRVLSRNRQKPVNVRINSFGGLAYDGIAIYNALADHPGKVTATIESVAASAASLAAIGADEVRMYENATYHIHEGLAFAYGHAAEIRETLDWLETFNAVAADTYAAKTGKPAEYILAALEGENGDGTKYTAKQALATGFIDTIIPLKASKSTAAASVDASRMQSMLTARILRHRATAVD